MFSPSMVTDPENLTYFLMKKKAFLKFCKWSMSNQTSSFQLIVIFNNSTI